MSFCGRLLSGKFGLATGPANNLGIGSDFLVTKLHLSRYWCLLISSVIFLVAQLVGATVQDPNHLYALSGLTGCKYKAFLILSDASVAYGFLFGAAPALLAETFGVHGLSQNWGCITLAPIIFGNVFNLVYGRIYDQHSTITPEGHHDCRDGRSCYNSAYWVTFGASLITVALSLWSIKWHQIKRNRMVGSDARREGRFE